MFSLGRCLICAFALVLTCGLTGCGGEPATISTFNEFSQKVQAGNYSAAYAMLTDESKKNTVRNEGDLKALCEGPLANIFKPTAGAKATVLNSNFDTSGNSGTGDITLIDASGKATGKVGNWTVYKVGGAWKVHWTIGGAPRRAAE